MFFTLRTLIIAMLSIALSALTGSATSPATVSTEFSLSTENTVTTEVDIPLTACEKLNYFDEIYDLDLHGFEETLNKCKEESKNDKTVLVNGTIALMAVYDEVKGQQCKLTNELADNLMECVNSVIGFQPLFTSEAAKKHFGPNNNTQALRFKNQECIYSEKVRKCVEKKLTSEQSGCKTIIMRGFNITAEMCITNNVPGKLSYRSIGSGIRSSPLVILIVSSAVTLIKLIVCS